MSRDRFLSLIDRKTRVRGAVLAALAAVFALGVSHSQGILDGPASAEPREVPPSRDVVQYSFAPIVRKAAPAVVNVYVRRRVQTFSSPFANDPFFRQFFGEAFGRPSERVQSSLGSGVIVGRDGVVVTNTHVIKGRGEAEIRVALSDKREFDATVISQDEKSDLALLKIEGNGEKFPTLELENSDSLEVGDIVLAIGNPFGVGQTVTNGIISALGRSEVGANDAQVFIQTDAPINPGNSGGALVDMSGKLVGINTMIFSQSGGSHGIGFAIPSNLVRLYVDGAASGKKIERPWLGAKLESVTREIAEGLALDRVSGAVVMRISDRGPAADAGLKAGDVITHVDGFEVTDARALQYRLTTTGVGNSVKLDVLRKGKPLTVTITLVAAPKPGRDDVRNLAGAHPLDGARGATILPAIADEFNLEAADGVVVISVRDGSLAQRFGFQAGDVIVTVGGTQIHSLADLDQALGVKTRVWSLSIQRGGKVLSLQVPL